jgi:hypothetical protein
VRATAAVTGISKLDCLSRLLRLQQHRRCSPHEINMRPVPVLAPTPVVTIEYVISLPRVRDIPGSSLNSGTGCPAWHSSWLSSDRSNKYLEGYAHLFHVSSSTGKVKLFLYRPWSPLGLREVEASTFFRHSAHRWRQGCQPYASATFYPQEDS